MEVAMKAHINDKTNWRRMLTDSDPLDADLALEKARLAPLFPEELKPHITGNDHVIRLTYPVVQYPRKVNSLNLDKEPHVSGTLTGIKGQYLLFKDGSVINLRKYGGYLIRIQTRD
jgi:hypothetical protein